MNNRERVETILEGENPDRIPFMPRLRLWFSYHKRKGSLPERYRGKELSQVYKDLGLGNPARSGKVFDIGLKDPVEIKLRKNGRQITTLYKTPLGEIKTTEKSSQAEFAPEVVEPLISSPADYEIARFVVDHLEFIPTFDDYKRYERQIDGSGLPLVPVGMWPPHGTGVHCPIHAIFRYFLGYKKGYIHLLSKYPDQVKSLMASFEKKALIMERIVEESPAKFILHGANVDYQITPPPIFKQYFLPYLKKFVKKMHSSNKKVAFHVDGESKGLLESIYETGVDCAECFATFPLVDKTTIKSARDAWGNKVVIWGGIPSTVLEYSFSKENFEKFIYNVLKEAAPGDTFILGISDNMMPSSEFDRLTRINNIFKDLSNYPLCKEEIEQYFQDKIFS